MSEKELRDGNIELARKVEELAKDLGAVEEDGTNAYSKYSFISSNQMVALMRDLLLKHKLSIMPEVVESHEKFSINDKQKQVVRTTVKMEFTLTDLETGFEKVLRFQGADQDTGGKSFPQAVTECTKRFYFKMFKVSSKEEIDGDSGTISAKGNPLTGQPDSDMDELEKACPKEKGMTNNDVLINQVKWICNKAEIGQTAFKTSVANVENIDYFKPSKKLVELQTLRNMLWGHYKHGLPLKKLI